MKKLLVLVLIAAFTVASTSFADVSTKHAPTLDKLAQAWKNQQFMHAKVDKNDITIVYGGADVSSPKSAIRMHSVIA